MGSEFRRDFEALSLSCLHINTASVSCCETALYFMSGWLLKLPRFPFYLNVTHPEGCLNNSTKKTHSTPVSGCFF